MNIFKLFLFHKGGTNSGEMDFFCSTFTRLTILVATTFNDLCDTGVVEILVIASLTILYFSMGYWIQT